MYHSGVSFMAAELGTAWERRVGWGFHEVFVKRPTDSAFGIPFLNDRWMWGPETVHKRRHGFLTSRRLYLLGDVFDTLTHYLELCLEVIKWADSGPV